MCSSLIFLLHIFDENFVIGMIGYSFQIFRYEYSCYKLSPKSLRNLSISFSGQSEVGSSPPMKKRSTGGS